MTSTRIGLAVTTRAGQVHHYRQPTRRGDPDFPMTDTDIDAKFHMLADPVIGVRAAATLCDVLWRVDALESVARIPVLPEGAG